MALKRVTSLDVAKLADVSRTTVSLVLNNVPNVSIRKETRNRVFQAAKDLGYVPDAAAQALVTQRSKAIGLVMTRSPHHIASDTFLPQILGGLLKVINEHKFRLLIESVDQEHQDKVYLELALAKHIDGIILLTPRINDKGLKKLEEFDIPTVLMGKISDSNLHSVDVDNYLAAKKATQYLIDLGHKNIACIANANPSFSSASERIQGFKETLINANITPNEKLIRYADFDPQSGFDCMQSLIQSGEEFSAVFVTSDNVAIGANSALWEAKIRIPEDISVFGFDDIPWAAFASPPLTTMRLPAQELASKACLLLLDLMKGTKQENRHLVLETELIVRQSCRRL
ncbi:MAG: LacI family DNA-binding transcriptional regulator [Anaerolineaceae bacterium]|nr:LacI family DNA-binding transcriptional regulator [Anaerolineaceae bacterium]